MTSGCILYSPTQSTGGDWSLEDGPFTWLAQTAAAKTVRPHSNEWENLHFHWITWFVLNTAQHLCSLLWELPLLLSKQQPVFYIICDAVHDWLITLSITEQSLCFEIIFSRWKSRLMRKVKQKCWSHVIRSEWCEPGECKCMIWYGWWAITEGSTEAVNDLTYI